MNLGSFEMKEYYSSASVELDGKNPGETVPKKGKPMVYGITVPKNADNPALGLKFVEFVVSPKGQKIMSENGHPVLTPAETKEYEKLPASLKQYAK